jgi:NADP-dependent 3-hydroxy acid dehydrogenase YdfG
MARPHAAFRNIVITGASSGIGTALAKFYARPGVTLGLTGRDTARLGAVAEQARAAGASVHEAVFDLRDQTARWKTAPLPAR